MSATFTLVSPVTGRTLPLERVPDPVFAGKLVGDGVAVDPLGERIVAPCDGTIAHVHPCGHALTVRHPSGVEVLIHVGLDTVRLRGEGFTPRVKAGDTVKAGATLLDFQADHVATRAASLLTMVVVVASDLVASVAAVPGNVTAGTSPLLNVILAAAPAAGGGTAAAAGETVVSEAVLVPNAQGIHARPAAVLAQHARRFRSEIAVAFGEGRANARSVVGLLALNIRSGDAVRLHATGPDARGAVAALLAEIAAGLGEAAGHRAGGSAPATPAGGARALQASQIPADPNLIRGIAASPGIAAGPLHRLAREEQAVVPAAAGSPEEERAALRDALDRARGQLAALRDRHAAADKSRAAIFDAHGELLADPDLLDIAWSAIDKGRSAAFAWREACDLQAGRLAALDNELLAGRAVDLRDVGRRVLRLLNGDAVEAAPDLPAGAILIAEELSPSDAANLDPAKVAGFATVAGGATSHVAILARSLGIPALAGCEPRLLDLVGGATVILDGAAGTLRLSPTAADLERARADIATLAARRREETGRAHEPAATRDGHAVAVLANAGSEADAVRAAECGAEGIGLLRSEFLFLDRTAPPTEAEQETIYRAISDAVGKNSPLTIRTLDVGGDKPLAYLPVPKEENPFLGERGLRLSLDRPDLFRAQLRALLRASAGRPLSVMFPMVATLDEWRAARLMLNEEAAGLGLPAIPAGIMVEVPSAALIAARFAPEVDFFSIGTNDLTQYTLAMDRGHPRLAMRIDGLHPAVLALVERTVAAARVHGKPVSVCGGLAAEAAAVPILVGLGVDKLSVPAPAVPAVKALIRLLDFKACEAAARQALAAPDAAAVRAIAAALTGAADRK